MKRTTTYTKSQAQLNLEQILHFIKNRGLTVSQLKNTPQYIALYQEFNETLLKVINILVHEQAIHDLITSIARSYHSQYYEDLKEYDTLFEVISETLLGLNSIIKKSTGNIDNTGRIRIDTYLDKDPEFFVQTLRAYIRNNIIIDLARHYGINEKHITYDIVENNYENEYFNKLDSVKYNRTNIENTTDFTDNIISKISHDPNLCSTLINAIVTRFANRKAVAGYIYLCIMNKSYNPRTIVNNLKTKDFNQLFHTVLNELELSYPVDLSAYKNVTFSANKYLESFRTVNDADARSRIDKLATQTRKDVKTLQPFNNIWKKHVSNNGKYFTL